MHPLTSSTPPVGTHHRQALHKLDGSLDNAGPTPITVVYEDDHTRILAETVRCLPELERTIIELHHQHGLTFHQVGEHLGCVTDEVVRIWARAIDRISRKPGSLVNG